MYLNDRIAKGMYGKSSSCICMVLMTNLPVFTLKEPAGKAPYAAGNQLQVNRGSWEDRLKTPVLGEVKGG